MTIQLRKLSGQERQNAFARGASSGRLAEYVNTVREMEGGIAYGIAVNGTTARAIRVNMSRAAKRLGLSLRWAKVAKDAKELIVELAE